jgi:hypothetical protein
MVFRPIASTASVQTTPLDHLFSWFIWFSLFRNSLWISSSVCATCRPTHRLCREPPSQPNPIYIKTYIIMNCTQVNSTDLLVCFRSVPLYRKSTISRPLYRGFPVAHNGTLRHRPHHCSIDSLYTYSVFFP